MPTARLRDGNVHYEDEGSGEPIVFVHGTPTCSHDYRHLIAALRANQRCLALDHLGFGRSERPAAADYRPEAHAARFAEWMDTLALPPCTLVVHDYGGPIALAWAFAQPGRVKRVVLINTWFWSFEGDTRMLRLARFAGGFWGRLLYRYLNASLRFLMPSAYADKKRLTPELHGHYSAFFPDGDSRERVLHRLARGLLESHAHFARLWSERDKLAQHPMLIVWGMADSAFPASYLERLRCAFPQAETLSIDDAGHWPHEERPELVAQRLAAFCAAD